MKHLARVERLKTAIRTTDDPVEVWKIDGELDALETHLRASGIINEIIPCREARWLARWRFGQLLADVERAKTGPGPIRSTGLTQLVKALGISRQTAMQAQRLAALPEDELEEILARFRQEEELATLDALVESAKPYWYLKRRGARHKNIAKALRVEGHHLGPFALIYADPPWVFETYTPKGNESHRMPDDHYPTMPDAEIMAFEIGGVSVLELAHKDAALFMWCTSSNIVRALAVMDAWGFTYKTHAVWDKMQIGLGLVFRNQHEVLLYGDRGRMPKPAHVPPSVFRFKRTAHSRKPPEIRAEIEKMYPHFDAAMRAEFFSRGGFDGWTCFGNEASDLIAGRSEQPVCAVG